MRRTLSISLICFALCVQSANAWSQEGQSPVNQVLGIQAQDDASGTQITILGSASPTFSVYRLERPPRLFVDFSNSELAGEVTNWAVRNGLVDEVLALQYRDEVSLVTRVVVALDREEAEYDIETTDTDVIISIWADGWQPAVAMGPDDAAQPHSNGSDPLDPEVAEFAEREQRSRARADRLSNELAEVEEDLESARRTEQSSREALSELSQQADALEEEIDALTVLMSNDRAGSREVSQARDRRAELQAALEQIRAQRDALGFAIADAVARRQRFEEQAAEAEAEFAEARSALNTAQADLEAAQNAAAEARRELAGTEAEVERSRLEQRRIEAELAEQRSQRESIEAEVTAAEQRRAEIDIELAHAEQQLTATVEERERLDQELSRAAEERQRLESELNVAVTERHRIDSELRQATAQRQRLESELESASGQRTEIEAELAAIAAQRRRLEAELADATAARAQLDADLDRAAAERARLQEELVHASSEREQLDTEINEARARRASLDAELAQMALQQEQEAQALAQARSERMAIQSEIATLESRQQTAESAFSEVEQARVEAITQLDELEDARQSLHADVRSVETLRRNEQAELNRIEQQRLEAESALSAVNQQRTQLAAEVAGLERRLSQLQDDPTGSSGPMNGASAAMSVSDSAPDNSDRSPSADGAETAEIVDVRFSQLDGVDVIEVEFDGPAPAAESLPWQDGRGGLVIGGGQLPLELQRTLDTRAFGGPVQFVSSYTDDRGAVRLVVELAEAASEILSREGNVVSWEFGSVHSELAQAEPPGADPDFEGYNSQEEVSQAPPIRRPGGLSYTIGQRDSGTRVPRLSRRFRVTIDVVNADIQNVLRLFSDQGDVNIIASGSVSGSITLRLRDVPLDQAFALILRSQGLGWEQRGNIIRVAPLQEFEDERQRELQRIAQAFDVEPLQVRLRPISYASGGGLISLLSDVLSARGSASFDDRTHTLILTDVAENLDAAEQLIDALDTQTPQVLIEARFVQTTQTFSQGFGIQWGGDALLSAANGNPTGLLFPSTIGIAGGAGQTPSDGTAATPNYAVNLPGPSNGAVGFQFGSLGQAVNLNLRLSAAESSGEAKVVSAPRILTLDGQGASISTGVSIPVQTVGAAGTNVTFIQANLSLNVTPVVTPDGFVHLNLNVNRNEPDFARTGANGDPTITTRTATTNLLVRDGETSVIGGIFEHIQGSDQNAVPFFSDIPILGALFHDYSFQDERSETLIFITPRIVNRDLSLTNYTPGGVLMSPPE